MREGTSCAPTSSRERSARRGSPWTSSPPPAMACASSPRWVVPRGSSPSISASSSGTGTTCPGGGTDARVLNYLLLPWRAMADLRRLAVLARGADLVVNDSLHPALLLAPVLGFPHPVVQVYGENLWRAMESNLDDRAPAWVVVRYRRALAVVRDRAFARIVHTLGEVGAAPGSTARTFRLAPIVARPDRTRARCGPRVALPR